jgi:hypothetical protein
MRHTVLPLLALALAAATASPAQADPLFPDLFPWRAPVITDSSRDGVVPVRQARQLSLREVAQIIDARVPGRLSDAQLVEQNGRMVYVIRWEPSDENARGRIIIFVVDAETGAILSRRG